MQAGMTIEELRERFSAQWEIVSADRFSADQLTATVARRRIDASFEFSRCRLRPLPYQ